MAVEINYSETRGPNVDDFQSPQPTLSCFLPICLYSFMVNRVFLQEYVPWAVSRCSKTKIVIGDFLERHNIMAFESVTEIEAVRIAKRRGDKILSIIESILSKVENTNSVTIFSCRKDIETSDCRNIANNLHTFAETNTRFKKDLEEQTGQMLNGTQRISRHRLDEISTHAIDQLHEYMIEELALYIHLYNQGFTTEIYPGRDMKILRKIAAAQYKGFPYDFSERTHISVAVLLDSGTSYARLDNNSKGDLQV